MPFADTTHLTDLNGYLSRIDDVRGWCVPQLWQMLWPLARAIGPGPVAEIGIYEGKFLIGLIKTFDPDNAHRHAAIDVFDLQEFNLDGAGVGNEAAFDANLVAQGLAAARVEKVRTDSLALTLRDANQLAKKHGRFAAFSVDGCHEVTHTMADIEFAMSVVDPRGIIFVDDYINPQWPGVGEAVAKMYLLRNFAFVPLAYGCNKLILCSISYHKTYLALMRDYLKAAHPKTPFKEVTRFGFRTLTVLPKLGVPWTDIGDDA
jgi:Methyltransferase domain